MKPAIQVENLSKMFRINENRGTSINMREALSSMASNAVRKVLGGAAEFSGRDPHEEEKIWALRDVSFSVGEGEAVAIVGSNGSGKSTLLKILSGIMQPTSGEVDVRGRVGSLLEVGTGFHAELSGRENIYLNGAIIGMKKREIDRKFDEIVAFSGVEKFLDTPVKHYSSGMYVRLAFSVAAHLEPDIFLVDEVLAVGDVDFQKKCLDKMQEIVCSGRTVLLVSHNIGALTRLCKKGILLRDGELVTTQGFEECLRLYVSGSSVSYGKEWVGSLGDESLRLLRFAINGEIPEGNCFERGHKFILEMDYEVLQPEKKIVVGVDLCNASGEFIAGTRVTDLLEDVPCSHIQSAGRHSVSLEVDTGILTDGSYLLKCNLGIHNVKRVIDVEPTLAFQVFHCGKNTRHFTTLYSSVIYPDWVWRVG